MAEIVEFFSSLGVIGWVLFVLCILLLINLGKIFRLRSPLDSQQHKSWRSTGGITKADHLEQNDKEI